MEATWSLGVLIGLPVTLLVLVAAVVWIALVMARDDRRFGLGLGIGVIVVTLGVALSPLGFYPYAADYHRWEPVSGQVSQIAKRIVPEGDSIAQKFVVRFEGSQQEYGCEDTRCAITSEGDHLTLMCKRVWQYAGVDGYDCRYVSNRGGDT